jgi:chloramphenicol 3-O-phosphotransferase
VQEEFMKLICIYGPPASGKLAVAREISSQTGIKLFHNHLTIDLAEAFFDWGTPGFVAIRDTVRFTVFEEAAKANIDLIFTLVYSTLGDDSYVEHIVRTIETNGGQVCFVRLQCNLEILKERVLMPERKQFNKISSIESLDRMLSRGDLFAAVPYDSLDIDTCRLTPSQAATKIVEHYNLPPISER